MYSTLCPTPSHILHSVCTASFVLCLVSFTSPDTALNLAFRQQLWNLPVPQHQQPPSIISTSSVRRGGGEGKRLLFNSRIPHALIQPAFTRRNDHALSG